MKIKFVLILSFIVGCYFAIKKYGDDKFQSGVNYSNSINSESNEIILSKIQQEFKLEIEKIKNNNERINKEAKEFEVEFKNVKSNISDEEKSNYINNCNFVDNEFIRLLNKSIN